jgi:hypothetical protein
MDVLDKTETFFAEVRESFEDIVAEAKAEHAATMTNEQRPSLKPKDTCN